MVDEIEVTGKTPREVRQAGVAHIPEDRLSNGLSLASSIDDNLIVDRLTSPLLKKGWSLTKKLLKTMERN